MNLAIQHLRAQILTMEQHAAAAHSSPSMPAPSGVRGGLERPLRMFRDPVRVALRGDSELTWNGRCLAIRRMTGPERIETGWWQERDERRDYYIAETTSGSKFWLFQSIRNGAWFLHGAFE